MASTYEVGTRAWQPDAAEGWVASELINKTIDGNKAKLTFQFENGEVRFSISYFNMIPSVFLHVLCKASS
jgi:myosin heavy subunit